MDDYLTAVYPETTMPCRDITQLHPTLQRAHAEIVKRGAAQGLLIGVNQTYRSIAYQNELYAQGRTKPGQIVTNAIGGNSYHNYRVAFDVHRLDKAPNWYTGNNWAFYDGDGWFRSVAKIWQGMGGKWGGTNDGPHMEYTAGKTINFFKTGGILPDDLKMPWENEIKPIIPEEIKPLIKIYNTLSDIEKDKDMSWALDMMTMLSGYPALDGLPIIRGNLTGNFNLTATDIRIITILKRYVDAKLNELLKG